MTKLAVIVLNWNGESLLREFLPSVVENSSCDGVEIWVADNASADASEQLVKAGFPTVKWLAFDKNYGFAGGYNRALKHIDCTYALLLNSDVMVPAGWLDPLLRVLDTESDVAACAPKLRDYKNPAKFEYAGASGGFLDKNCYAFCRGRMFHDIEFDTGQYDDETEVFWASGAALMVRRSEYLRFGGLDEDFFAHMEEIDLCWRMKNSGLKIKIVPSSVVYHVGGATLSETSPFKTYLNFRNNLLMMYKNLPEKGFTTVLFKRKVLDTLAMGVMLLKFDFKNAIAVVRAHLHYYRMVRNTYRHKRKICLLEATSRNETGIIRRNVVFLHFTGKLRCFNELEKFI
ncbi:MAG TPA: glycosyltransferase family 2 protein [Bacteroidales bacterium]|nr:glycosyltransferase family 2 protein [Bacteroidales bacterium]